MYFSHFLPIVSLAGAAAAQVTAWGRCGGIGYTGPKTCVSGYHCVYSNDWYSQCVPGGAPEPSTTTTKPPSTTTTKTSNPDPTGGVVPFRFLGRVNPATRELTWPGTGVSFTFTGTSASIGLKSVSGAISVDLIIDGGAPILIPSVAVPSINTPTLSQGKHTVVIRKRSETYFGTMVIGDVTVTGTAGVDAPKTRKIEFIGDSITVGYGLDGTLPCTDSAVLQDNPKTYAALAAKELNADYSVVAWSGKGLTRNYASSTPDTSPLMPQLYTRYGANDADNSYTFPAASTPDVVVIALGTNDWSYLNVRDPIVPSVFTAAMVNFVKSIRTHYPNASYFLLGSPLLGDSYPTVEDAQHTTHVNALKAAISQLGGKIYFVDWPSQGSDVGCDYHPNAATNAAEAPILASAIKSALGW